MQKLSCLPRVAVAALLLLLTGGHTLAAEPAPSGPTANETVIAPALALEYAGTYRLGAGHDVTLGPFDEFGGHLVYLDMLSLDQRVLTAVSTSEFVAGPTALSSTPVQTRIRFERGADGRVTGLRWQPVDGAEIVAPKVYLTRREIVEFRNGDVVLRGVLAMPAGPGPHPAVVLVHGSGPATRNVGFFNTFYERLGIAVLSFDKRGAGESSGNWKAAGFDELADDVLAGVAMLKARADIDPKRIGLDGSSQGGWVGSMAAAKSPDVAWLQVRVGSGVTVVDNMLYEDIAEMAREGLDAKQTEAVVAFDRAVYALGMRGERRQPSNPIAAAVKDESWFKALYPSGWKTSDNGWTWMHRNGAIDATDYLRRVRCPVNWYLGASDGNVPSARSMPRLVQALIDGGNHDFAVHMLPSDHSFIGLGADRQSAKQYVAGYWDSYESFLRARGFAGPVADSP